MASSSLLTEQQKTMHLRALNVTCRKKLSLYLNLESLGNVVNDYRGLAERISFDYLEIMNFGRDQDPTGILLREWTQRSDLKSTIGKLVEYLEDMGREDILTDCLPLMIRDIDNFRQRTLNSSPVQDQTISQSSGYSGHEFDVDDNIMCISDIEDGHAKYFDAFICFDPEGEDLKFVKHLISVVENPPHNLKLFVPGRDDLAGSSAHTINAALIEHRCKKMVIIMSKRYLKSEACDFQTKFAFCLSPGSRLKKLVPVLIEECVIPSIIRHITMCDYTKIDLQEWIWRRLVYSIKAPLSSMEWLNPVALNDIILNVSPNYKQVISGSSSTLSPSSASNTSNASNTSSASYSSC